MCQQIRRTTRPLVLVTALVAAAALLAGCGSSSSTSSSQASSSTSGSAKPAGTFNVLAILPKSGALAAIGQEQAAGLQAAVTVVNHAGGVLGHRVVLTVADDGGTGTMAISALQGAMASGTKFNLIIPGAFGAEAIPLAAALAKTPILQISPGSESSLTSVTKYPYHFTTTTGYGPNTSTIIAKLKHDGVQRVTEVVGADPSGLDGAASMAQSAAAAGIKLTTVSVPDTSVDATAEMQKAEASNPQALTMDGFTPANPAIIKARAELGVKTPFYLDVGAGAVNFAQFSKPAQWAGLKVETFPFLVQGQPATQTPAYSSFLAAFKKLDPAPVATIYAPITTWEAMMLARAAAIKANSIDGPAMVTAMNHVTDASMVPDWIGPRKVYLPTDHTPRVAAGDFIFVNPGPMIDGLMVPKG